MADFGETVMDPGGKDLGIHHSIGDFTGGRIGGDGDLHLHAPEYGRTIHCDATYPGPSPGGGVESRIAGP